MTRKHSVNKSRDRENVIKLSLSQAFKAEKVTQKSTYGEESSSAEEGMSK